MPLNTSMRSDSRLLKRRAALAAEGCAVHTPPKLGMVDPPPWNKVIYARRYHVENLFSKLKDWSRIALRRDETRRSWMAFAHLAAAVINLRVAKFDHKPSAIAGVVRHGCQEVCWHGDASGGAGRVARS